MMKNKFNNILKIIFIIIILVNILFPLKSINKYSKSINIEDKKIFLQNEQEKINLDEEFFNSNDLGIGLFFSTKYNDEFKSGDINSDLGLYVTNNG